MISGPISKFMARVKAAQQGRSKDVRISIDEAHEVVMAIAELMAIKVDQLKDSAPKPQQQPVEVKMDGGAF